MKKAQKRRKTVVRGRAEERNRGKCNKADGVTTCTRRTTVLPRILSPPKRLLKWMWQFSAPIVHFTSSTSINSSPLRFTTLYTVRETVVTSAGTQNGVFNSWLSQRREALFMSFSDLQISRRHLWQLLCCFWFILLEPSGHYMHHQFNIHKFYLCPQSVFMCFVWIWEQTAIISLYNINWLVFITETECVYCALRSTFYVLPTKCIYVFCVDLRTNSDYFTVQH